MDNLKVKKDGYVNVFIATLIALFILLTAVYVCIKPLQKLGVYNQLLDVARGAMLRTEADGGLTDQTKQLINDTIADKGLDPSLLTISCNQVVNPGNQTQTNFGTKVKLTLQYSYTYTPPKIIGFSVSNGQAQTEILEVSVYTTAKN